MAKASFHKNQRVYVQPVGTWAQIEQVKPQWVRDVPEPVRIFYDCGLGRDFTETELSAPEREEGAASAGQENWRLMRARNKWQDAESSTHHPFPGTFPVVVTDEKDWGGWRVPGQEYDRDPQRIEYQARIMVSGMRLKGVADDLINAVRAHSGDIPADIQAIAKQAQEVLKYIESAPKAQGGLKAAE